MGGDYETHASLLDAAPRMFVYPYGAHDHRVRDVVAEWYPLALTTDEHHRPDVTRPFELSRIQVDPAWSLDAFRTALGSRTDPAHAQRATRRDPFREPANGWYFPGRTSLAVDAGDDDADVIIVRSPTSTPDAHTGPPVALQAPFPQTRGTGSWERDVTTLLTPPTSVGLLLGETLARDGRWSTYPPHRHEHSNPPHESALQKAFAFRVRPASGFGVLLTYDEDVTQAHSTVLGDGTVTTVPGGFHTVAVAAGHDLHYLWAAHGAVDTQFALHTDPQHAWLLGQ